MAVTLEEEVVLLYALSQCGGKPSKARAIHFILSNNLFKFREGDEEVVETGESRVENRIAWTRQNLKEKLELSMPENGIWAITEKGRKRLERVALRSLNWEEPEDDLDANLRGIRWDRFSNEFLQRLKTLGEDVKRRSAA